ncbi:MAG: GntR family transcriptional regulator [Erysipelotrichaceae bacterium]
MNCDYIKLNKLTAMPLYYQLKECFKDAIMQGILKPNDKLPTEEELCRTFSISRPVIRQAYSELINEGIITRYKGKGTFVREREIKGAFFRELSNFQSEMIRLGLKPSTKLLKAEVIPYKGSIFTKLNLDPQDECLHIRRLRFGDDNPIVLVETFVPLKFFPGIQACDFTNQSLYDIFEKQYSTYVTRAERTIEARIIEDEDAELLDVAKHSAIHFVKTTAYDQGDRLVEYSIAIYPGEKNVFDVVINRNIK